VTDWNEAPLSELAEHIVSVHHARTRAALPRLSDLLTGDDLDVFEELRVEIEEHMRAEEERLFPAIAGLERDEVDTFPLEELPTFEAHHLRVAAAMRGLVGRVSEPEAQRELRALDDDLRAHLHEEHNLLFPRALAALGRAYA